MFNKKRLELLEARFKALENRFYYVENLSNDVMTLKRIELDNSSKIKTVEVFYNQVNNKQNDLEEIINYLQDQIIAQKKTIEFILDKVVPKPATPSKRGRKKKIDSLEQSKT